MSDQLEAARLARAEPSWPVHRLRHLARLVGGGTPAKGETSFWAGGTVPWASPKDMKNRVVLDTQDHITEDAVDGSATSYVEPGSPLMVVRSGILRHTLPIAIAGCRLTLNQDMKAFRLSKTVGNTFFAWWVEGQSSELLLEWRQFGATVESIDTRRMMDGRIALPTLDTQRAITTYLNREVASIDQLIEKKERFVGTIDAKRKALTARLVDGSLIHGEGGVGTFGWFGVLPKHWPIRRARFLFRERLDLSLEGSEELLTVSHITGVTTRAEKDVNMFLAETLEGYKIVQPDDLVVNTMWAWMGALGVSSTAGCASPSYAVYRPKPGVFDSGYLDLVVRSLPFVAEVNRRSKGIWASRLRLYPEAFLDIAFPVPSLSEQKSLVRALKDALLREEQIGAKAQRSVALLKERRAALITAAVTGQIDVRDTAVEITTKPDRSRLRLIVGAEIVDRHRDTRRFGRIKNQKLLYLAEAHAGIRELGGNYIRFAAGPYDEALIKETERGMEAAAYYRAQPANGDGRGVTYVPLAKAGQHGADLKTLLGDRTDALRRLIDLLRDFDTEAVEAITTLYAVWNDALMDGETPDDAALIRGVLREWHPDKMKFTEDALAHWIDWMKRTGLVPHGQGPRTAHTMTRDLFA